MTLEEAIETLNGLTKGWPSVRQFDQLQALKLGIEALKMWGEVREIGRWPASTRLVGETKE